MDSINLRLEMEYPEILKKMVVRRGRFIGSLISLLFMLVMVSCNARQEESDMETLPVDNLIRLSDAQIQLANINVANVREGFIGRKLSLTGVLKVNEQSVVTVSSRIPGRIEILFFKNTGETVSAGDKLYEIYSDKLIDAQREYFTLQSNNWNYSGRYEPSLVLEDKLMAMGMMPSQIKQLGKDGKIQFRVVIYSPDKGKIRSVNVSEGQYIESGQTLFVLAADNELWLEAQVYPDEIQFLKIGMPAEVIIPLAGEMPVKCKLSFINPAFEKDKNITLVRAVIDNRENRLHPGMLAILNIQTQTSYGIVIPTSAVISGRNGDRVWIREGTGEFSPRMITSGLHSGDSTLVLSGLDTSDKIVTTGVYLLNSELILKQGISSPGGSELLNKRTGNKEEIARGF